MITLFNTAISQRALSMSWRGAIMLIIMVVLNACTHNDISDYKDNQPKLNVSAFFNGSLTASGLVKNRRGQVIRTFNADIQASWKNNIGTLDETFIFSDGELKKRIWTLRPDKNGRYLASANDVVGVHTMSISGNALFMRYVLSIDYGDSTIDVSVDDRMFLVNPNVIINESILSKWGFDLATVQLTIFKHSSP